MSEHQKFFSLYKKLNTEQKKAVDTIEGPVMVIAGPGTGKTQILTLRIANILRLSDTAPESILALTFTESGAFSMRKRLVEIIGGAGYRVRIRTFHGFANEIIQEYPDEFPKIIGARNSTDVEKISILKKIITSLKSPLLKPYGDTFYYLPHVRKKISELKREYVAPNDFFRFVREQKKELADIPDLRHERGVSAGEIKGKYARIAKQIERSAEFFHVYRDYEKELIKKRLYDYEDMITETVRALLENKELLLRLQEEHQYILADEHQDANRSQNRLLELLASFHENPNLFIVGDEKQAIYRFQGASLENFLYFKRLYPESLIVTLEENYRSTQTLLDAAHSLALHGSGPRELRVRLLAFRTATTGPVEIFAFRNPDMQYASLARDIEEKISGGAVPEEIAVLYRDNKDALPLSRMLEKAKVPFIVESDQNLLLDPLIRKLLLLARVVHGCGDNELLSQALHIDFLGIAPLDVYKIVRMSVRRRESLYDALGKKEFLRAAGVQSVEKMRALSAKLSEWKTLGENTSLLSFLETLIEESGFLARLLAASRSAEVLAKLTVLFDEAKTLVSSQNDATLTDFISHLDMLEEHGIPLVRQPRTGVQGKVRLMTAHKAKGLEFDYVYITDAHDGHWGNRRTVEYFLTEPISKTLAREEKNDDERRLFYVSLTRARLGNTITYAREDDEGKERLPAQFIGEMNAEFLLHKDALALERNIATHFFLTRSSPSEASLSSKKFLNDLFLEQGLSVTALNNFLRCPWNYFYSNLVRVPKAPEKHASFGTAVHGALKAVFDTLRAGKKAHRKLLLDSFDRCLEKELFSAREYEESRAKGRKVLSGYFDVNKDEWSAKSLTELKIEMPFSLPETSVSFPLRCTFYRVDFLEDARVRVVDYKTGKPKSRNEIEGKTKNSQGDYKRQLVFYKLLLLLRNETTKSGNAERFNMADGIIDFVEPDEKGKYHKETFVVHDEEVSALKELIGKTAREIYSLSFWNARCDEKDCRYCEMREMLD